MIKLFEKVDLNGLCDRLHNFSLDSQRRNNTVILVSDSGLISVLGPTDLIAALNTLHGTEPLTLCPMRPATGEEKDVLSTFKCRI